MSLKREQRGRYTNFITENGEIIVSVDEETGEAVIYDEGVEEPRAVWRPSQGWCR